MYLISQLWWFLLLAFLLGALLGYLLWRACGRRRIETHYERSNKELVSRLGALEQERSRFSVAAVDAEGDNAKFKAEIANLQGKLSDTSSRMNAAVDAADAKLKSYVDSVRHREETMGAEIEKLKKEATEARKAWVADKATAKSREDKLANDVALAQKGTGDAQRKNADDLKAAEKRWADEAQKKHTEELKKAQEHVRTEAQALHATELKKVQDQAKQHETKVLALTQADTGARKELEDAKARHTAELKNARHDAAADAAKKHADDVKKARDQAVAEVQAKHAEELKRVRAEASAVAKRAHDDELARFKREAVTLASPAPAGPAACPAPSPAPSPVALVDSALADTRSKAPGSIATARDGKADDLKLIWGVGPEIEKLLNQNGIYHFDQVSAWTKADLTWLDTMSKAFEGRVEREKWVEQAKNLATGWRPDRVIGEKPAGLTILSGPRGGKADDLKLIWGVGPKLEKLLNGAGFFHFDQLAKWGAADIEWVDSQLGEFAGRAVRDKWVEQCKKLATGWRPASEVGEKPE